MPLAPSPPPLTPTPYRTLEEILHKLVQLIQEEDCVSDQAEEGASGGVVVKTDPNLYLPASPCSRCLWQTPG